MTADHDSSTLSTAAVGVTVPTWAGNVILDADVDAADQPLALPAFTVNQYVVPDDNPDTVSDVPYVVPPDVVMLPELVP